MNPKTSTPLPQVNLNPIAPDKPESPNTTPPQKTSEQPAQESQPPSIDPELEYIQSLPPLEEVAPGGVGPENVQGVLTKEQFYQGFKFAHKAGATATKLRTLEIMPDEEDYARAASDAIYDTAEEVPYLRWMIDPGNVYVQRCIVIGAYAMMKAAAVKKEIAVRSAAPGVSEVH